MRTIPSAAVGLVAFLPAAIAATLAFRATLHTEPRARCAWATIAAVYVLLAAEAVAMTRYAITAELRRLAVEAGVYSDRRAPQAIVLLVLVAVVAVIVAMLARSAPTRANGIARVATAAVLTIFIGESVSLHAIDVVVYTYVGPIRAVCWLWLACGWITTAAAIQCTHCQRSSGS